MKVSKIEEENVVYHVRNFISKIKVYFEIFLFYASAQRRFCVALGPRGSRKPAIELVGGGGSYPVVPPLRLPFIKKQ